jgi:hypothetical protein
VSTATGTPRSAANGEKSGLGQDLAVPAVNPIEVADGQHAGRNGEFIDVTSANDAHEW